jgi:V8-like Glu-specific endopeptidase
MTERKPKPRIKKGVKPQAPEATAQDYSDLDAFIGFDDQDTAEMAELDDETLLEDGYDLLTHGGGSLETVQGFSLLEPMVNGLGESAPCGLPEAFDQMPVAASIHFQGGPQETVCGRDDRVQIGTDGTLPWRMICQLLITMGNGTRSRGTGWLISPRTVMTAGHCVYSAPNGGWVKSIEVVPGMSGQLRPYGSGISQDFQSVAGWVKRSEVAQDYGCVILPEDARLGDKTGWFGFASLPDADLTNLLANNSGYPGDKAFGTQWYNAGRITGVEPDRLAYMFDTAPGQSGSPAWRYSKALAKRHVVGIHNYGGCANRSTRITPDVFRRMQAWKALGA